MKSGNIIYYVDKEAKYYFDMQFLELVHINEFDVDLYKCKILYNKYKFNDKNFKLNYKLKGNIDIFSKYNIATSLEEAENLIK